MIVKLLTEYHLEFLSLKGGCTCSSESTHVKMPHCWKSRVEDMISWLLQSHPLLSIDFVAESAFEPRHVISNNVAC